MALRVAPSASFLQSFLPIAHSALRLPLRQHIAGRWQLASLPALVLPIPSLVSDIWESILRAVPKKKTSHMKKRHRQMAGKALKDVTALNTCSSCGRAKRAHVLCPYCVASIKRWFSNDFKPEGEDEITVQPKATPKSESPGGHNEAETRAPSRV